MAAGFLPDPAEPLSAGFRAAVQTVLTTFLDGQRPLLEGIGPELDPVLAMARSLTAGGKRLRPAFCLWGHAAVGGDPGDPDVLAAAASLDLLHVSALVHDDLIDGSDTRRGQPAAHRRFEALHAGSGWRGTGTALGQAGAVLLGDLLVMWSVELLERAVLRLGRPHEALQLAQLMRTEVTCGQYLDVVAQVSPLREGGDRAAVDRAHRVVEHKSARYTVTRPLQLGAALSGPLPAATREALQQYGSHVGRAFQFRDDVLGVFGDEAVTGKPAGDDLREGKQTLLLAEARAGLAGAGLARLDALVGRPDLDADGVAEARDLIEASGALTRLETLIEDHGRQGLAALSGGALAEDGRVALEQLAHAALRRSS
ncbi:polyprenyl synthetase family protein [Auraticoccus sp. F435]|uniref:Polyprenyl synthetase family protein n=1 Tax=Auraticoccus cholistanensis TaxID=2656650 RepID=A0A6A9V1F5_9ACTN|nr:polyprenyl synthetase family protein [Auraticoccus cholistanensis]